MELILSVLLLARNYFDHKDVRSMMKFVRAFHSMDLKRDFLRSLNLLDQLLVLEEESGNFPEAVNIAMMMGDILREADLLEKAGRFKEAFDLLLYYVLANSLWSSGSQGWPLKQFAKKVELLERALSFAKEESGSFYELAYTEADILSNDRSQISGTMIHWKSSRIHESIRGEILCLWQLLDSHFHLNSSKFVWQDYVINDAVEGMILENQLSVDTLFYCWTCWKDNIVHILECLPSFKSQDIDQLTSYGKFELNYMGVRKLTCNLNEIYSLLVPEANWVIKLGDRFLKKNERLVSVDIHSLVSSLQSYWSSELLSVGIAVLRNLEALYKFSVNKDLSDFCQFQSLLHIYEVSKFILGSKCFSHTHGNLKTLEKFRRLPIDCLLRYIVPQDWKKSLTRDMAFLRTTEACKDLVNETIYENIRVKDRLTYGLIGRVVVMILGTSNLKNELYVEVMTRFEDNIPWKNFIQCLQWSSTTEISQGNDSFEDMDCAFSLYEALKCTYNVNWIKEIDYISPSCFMYLVERLLLLASCQKGFMFATKSSFIEWLNYQDENSLANLSSSPGMIDIHESIAGLLSWLTSNINSTINWIRKSNLDVKNYLPVFVLRLAVSMCLLHISSGNYIEPLRNMFGMSSITSQLPLEFCVVLKNGKKHLSLKVIAEAFKVIDNPLVIVKSCNNSPGIVCPNAVFVDFTVCRQKELILQMLFSNRVDSVGGESAATIVESSSSTSKEFPSTICPSLPNKSCASVSNQTSDNGIKNINMYTTFELFWDSLEDLLISIDKTFFYSKSPDSIKIQALLIKKWLDSFPLQDLLDTCIQILSSICGVAEEVTLLDGILVTLEDKNEMSEVMNLLEAMKLLSTALNARNISVENQILVAVVSQTIVIKRQNVWHILKKLLWKNANVEDEPSQASTAAGNDNQGATSSGHGNNRENTKVNKNKSKKNKGRKKGNK